MDTVYKKGNFNKVEKEFMTLNAYAMPINKIADELNRPYERVYDWITKNIRPELTVVVQGDVVHELRNSSEWKRLNLELTKEELLYFEDQYAQIVRQFKEDIVYTEKQQIFQFIKFDILMSRNMQRRLKAETELEKTQSTHDGWLIQFAGDPTNMQPNDLQYHQTVLQSIERLRREIDNKSDEYKVLHAEYTKLMENMKATRKERITKNQADKGSFLALLSQLKNEEKNNQLGRELELSRLATDASEARLSKPHTFIDGSLDYIITTVDTVKQKYIKEED